MIYLGMPLTSCSPEVRVRGMQVLGNDLGLKWDIRLEPNTISTSYFLSNFIDMCKSAQRAKGSVLFTHNEHW